MKGMRKNTMSTYFGFTNVAFTTTSADYELFDDAGIRNAITERLSITDDALTEILASGGIPDLHYQILISGTNASINNETYQPAFDDILISNGDFSRRKIQSIRIEDTGISGQFRFEIL